MKVKIVCIGKIKEKFYVEQIDSIKKDICKKNSFEIKELMDEPIPQKKSHKVSLNIINTEGNKILHAIEDDEYVIGLCIDGDEITTNGHKQVIKKAYDKGYDKITYVIGGSLGTSEELRNRMNYKLSFSKMTLPHQLMRVVLIEEIYRAYL